MSEPVFSDEIQANLRRLPSVEQVLQCETAAVPVERFGRPALVDQVRLELQSCREAIRNGAAAVEARMIVARAVAALSHAEQSSLRPLFNLTGTVLHTNLGRAILAETAIAAAVSAMRDAVALEYDLDSGKRGERDDHLRDLICQLTGAEDATVVNNNAAAVLLVLNALAGGKEAIVSRGELIEIGGAFRMPDIMARAGCRLVEVGTTNRTHERDYREAIGDNTGLILKVHTSNYQIQGFTREVAAAELAEIARAANVPLMNDLGSGTLASLDEFGLAHEPTVREAIAEGADIVTFSGDKLLGGPQAGFIVGRRELIARINKNPMKRALRVDKIRLAALEATLKLYRNPQRLAEQLPTLRHLARKGDDINSQAERLLPPIVAAVGARFDVSIADCFSQIGSGALPMATMASRALSFTPRDGTGSTLLALAEQLRRLDKPVIGHIERGSLLLDLRCLDDEPGFLAQFAALQWQ